MTFTERDQITLNDIVCGVTVPVGTPMEIDAINAAFIALSRGHTQVGALAMIVEWARLSDPTK